MTLIIFFLSTTIFIVQFYIMIMLDKYVFKMFIRNNFNLVLSIVLGIFFSVYLLIGIYLLKYKTPYYKVGDELGKQHIEFMYYSIFKQKIMISTNRHVVLPEDVCIPSKEIRRRKLITIVK